MVYLKNSKVRTFIRTVRAQCRKCNVRLILSKGYEVNAFDGERCQGYFCEPEHELALPGRLTVATGRRRTADWLFTLAHEYAHFLQWRDDSPLWLEPDYYTLETHTEKEALKICRQFKLPIPRRVLLSEHRKYMKKLSRVKLSESSE